MGIMPLNGGGVYVELFVGGVMGWIGEFKELEEVG